MGSPKVGGSSSVPVSQPSSQPDANTVTVGKREGWKDIAARIGVSVDDLKKANPDIRWRELDEGRELKIPAKKGPGQTETAGEVAVDTGGAAAEKKGELKSTEKAKSKDLQSEVTGSSGGLQASDGTLKTGVKGKEKEIKELQKDLNAWRKGQGLAEIKVTGNYDDATLKAVKQFEKKNEIKEDGIADPRTRDLLRLETNPNFKGLTEYDKNSADGLLSRHRDNPEARKEIMDIMSDPNFSNLGTSEKRIVYDQIKALDKGADFSGLAAGISEKMKAVSDLKKDESFKSLSAGMQEGLSHTILITGEKDKALRADIIRMATDDGFAKLPGHIQQEAALALSYNKSDNTYTRKVVDLVTGDAFQGMNKADQNEVLDWIQDHPDSRLVDEIAGLSAKKMGKLDDGDLSKLLRRAGIE